MCRKPARERLIPFLVIAAAAPLACSDGGDAAPGGFPPGLQIERTAQTGGTLVRNTAGTTWAGPARLVEELSIGVMEGAEEYMLAQPTSVAATDDEIFVLDRQDHLVRVYGFDGTHHRSFGQQGEGPGELNNPFSMFITNDGKILVSSGFGASKVTVFTLDGATVGDWRLGDRPAFRFFETPAGLFANRWIMPDDPQDFDPNSRPEAYQRIGPDGYEDEPVMIPDTGAVVVTMDIDFRGQTFPMPVPGAPQKVIWTLAPTGELIWGWPGEYRFSVRDPAGATTTVERYWDPVRLEPDEADYHRRFLVAQLRRNLPDFSWNGAEMPTTKPAYDGLVADGAGRIWVTRSGAGIRADECIDPDSWSPEDGISPWQEPCWRPQWIIDVFRLDGTYLGEVQSDARVGLGFIGDDYVLTTTEDDFGTPMVKLYRLHIPQPIT